MQKMAKLEKLHTQVSKKYIGIKKTAKIIVTSVIFLIKVKNNFNWEFLAPGANI